MDCRRTSDSVKTAFFFVIYVLNVPIPCTLHLLSELDIQYKMFTPVHTGVHKVKLNQTRPSCTLITANVRTKYFPLKQKLQFKRARYFPLPAE